PLGFQDPEFPAKVYKVEKAMYGLHQASRAWYGTLSKYLLKNGFQRAYSDSDYGGATQDRKSTTGGCQFLGRRLISWQCKKQTIIATSTTKAEYVTAASCCGQVLWIQNQLLDYVYNFMNTKIYIDNNSAICIVKNHVYHSKTKHIEIRHHFIRDCFEKKLISVDHIHTDENVADLLTKPFDEGRFWLSMSCEDLSREISSSVLCLIETTDEGTKILATVDGILRTVTELSLRRNLKLQDEEGIRFNEFSSNITTALVCLATNRTYNFSKMIFDGLVKNINNKGKGSSIPSEPHHTPSSEASQTSHTTHTSPTLLPVTTTSIPTVTPSKTLPIRQYTQRARIAQSSTLPTITNEHESPLRDVSQGEAYPTDSGFIAYQDRANIANLQRQHSDMLAKFQAQEVEINRLKEKVKLLEDKDGVVAQRSKDDAPIKGRSLDEREAAAERISDDSEEMATILTYMDAVTVLAGGVVDVPTDSGYIPTSSTPTEVLVPTTGPTVPTGSEKVPTASLVFATATVVTPYPRRKGKEVMVESDTPKKQKIQEQIDAQVAKELEEKLEREDQRKSEQIAIDAKVARIHVEEELQSMIDGLDTNNEIVAKYMQEYHQFALELRIERRIELISDLVKSNLGWKVKDFRGMTFKEVEAKFNSVWKQIEDFIPMGSKEEVERIKRKCLSLEQESTKKQKTSEEVLEEAKSPEEVPEEKVKEMMQLVPIEEVYVESLQVKHRIIDWKVYSEGQRSYCKITRLGGGVHHVTAKDKEISMQVEKDYPLRKGRIVRNKMHKAFPLQVIEFPLVEELPTASEESDHYQKKSKATAEKIALLSKVKKKLEICVRRFGVSPLVGLNSRGFTAGQAALKAASRKVTKHEKACVENQHVFILCVFNTFGFIAPEEAELFSRVQRVMHNNVMTPRSTDVVFKCIGFAIQKGLATQLVSRLPSTTM
nr:putative ribonuclease H-like domain-containing protein [Tanacetum cinerariifolium]